MDVVERGRLSQKIFNFFFTKTPNLFFCVCVGGGGGGGWGWGLAGRGTRVTESRI